MSFWHCMTWKTWIWCYYSSRETVIIRTSFENILYFFMWKHKMEDEWHMEQKPMKFPACLPSLLHSLTTGKGYNNNSRYNKSLCDSLKVAFDYAVSFIHSSFCRYRKNIEKLWFCCCTAGWRSKSWEVQIHRVTSRTVHNLF